MPASSELVKYEDAEQAPQLTEEELEVVKHKKSILDKLLSDREVARYKIDLSLGRGFSTTRPSHGALTFWESGKHFHGGGDAKLYFCPGRTLGVNDCEEFIPDPSQGFGFLLCPGCGNVWRGSDVHGEVLARLTPDGWARAMLKYFARMRMNADLRIKHLVEGTRESDIRLAAEREQGRQLGGEVLLLARQRHVRIYTLKSIIKDTSAGADLYGRILAFVKS